MNKTILIIEDDPFSQDFYNFIFKKAGLKSLIMEDGDLILLELEKDEMGIIIMDINLKNTSLNGERINGVKFSRMIKENEKFKNIPVLLVTAYSINANGDSFFDESLADDYIVKPIIDYNELIMKVKSLLKN
ncbi:MAG: response regulator [Ignavibacteriaceae bacterium]|nr:response regulator [Ignavibacteriaceae bacterium]